MLQTFGYDAISLLAARSGQSDDTHTHTHTTKAMHDYNDDMTSKHTLLVVHHEVNHLHCLAANQNQTRRQWRLRVESRSELGSRMMISKILIEIICVIYHTHKPYHHWHHHWFQNNHCLLAKNITTHSSYLFLLTHFSVRTPSIVMKGSSGTTMGNPIMKKEPSLLLVPIMMFTCNPQKVRYV